MRRINAAAPIILRFYPFRGDGVARKSRFRPRPTPLEIMAAVELFLDGKTQCRKIVARATGFEPAASCYRQVFQRPLSAAFICKECPGDAESSWHGLTQLY